MRRPSTLSTHARALAARSWPALLALALLACASKGGSSPPVWPGPGAEEGPAGRDGPAAAEGPAASIAAAPDGPTDPAAATETAPDVFQVKLVTTKGDVVVEVRRAWAPRGADRFYNLVKLGYFTDVALFRVIRGFMAQFGIHGNRRVNVAWNDAAIADDEANESNRRGTLTFATAGPDTRTTQLFINFRDNPSLDDMGFTPIGKVISGMDVVDSWEDVYGEGAPDGRGPDQGRLQAEGNAYLKAEFPRLDYIRQAVLVP